MLNKRLESFKFAFQGIKSFYHSEPNVKIHLAFALITIAGGFFFEISGTEWMMCILSISIVLTAEAFNTSIEYLTDLASPDYHELAKKTKDVAAAAVLISAFAAAIIGFMVFLPKILQYI